MSPHRDEVTLVCDTLPPGELLLRLRLTAWRGLRPAVVLAPGDGEGARLTRAAGGVIVRRASDAGGRVLADWDSSTLDDLARNGARIRPAAAQLGPTPRLDGLRALHVTSVHRGDDVRIFEKEVGALRRAGADASVLALGHRPTRTSRVAHGVRLVREARRRAADIYHLHDPELLPAGIWLARATGRPVVYDSHEYLGRTTRTKPWIPRALRVPAAVAVDRVERGLARRLAAVVAVTEDMALDFAAAGVPAVSVANFAPRDRFPDPGSPEGPIVAYVGALDRSRGRDLMLDAFPRVDVPGARLVLAGPGEPGALPSAVEHLGRVSYGDVPALLRRAAVVWIPLRRTPNNDLGRLTKVMEGMASGRPLVASDLARTAMIVRQSGCGIVVPHDDPAAHAAAISRLLHDPDEAARMGDAGRRAFLEGMTFEREADTLVRLYASLTGR